VTSDEHEIHLAALDGGASRLLLKARSDAVFAAGHLLFMREESLMAQPFDLDRLETTGEAAPFLEGVTHIGGASKGVFSASANGLLLYQPGEENLLRKLALFDRTSGAVEQVGEPEPFDDSIAVAPDDRLAAVTIEDAQLGSSDVWLVDLAAGSKTRFTFDPGDDIDPVWSPDGERLAFRSMRDGAYDLYVKTVSGAESEQLLLTSDKDKIPTDWSDDGRYLLYNSEGDVWVLPLDPAGEPRRLIESEFTRGAQLSPDGRWVLYSELVGVDLQAFITAFDNPGRRWQVSTKGGMVGAWRNDGRELFYVWDDGPAFVSVETSGASPRLLDEIRLPPRSDVVVGVPTSDFQKVLAVIDEFSGTPTPLVLVQNWTQELQR
jgi:TolB protein